MRPFLILFGADPALDHLHPFETSWLLPPAFFAALRGLISFYVFVSIFVIFGWQGTHGNGNTIGSTFSYFTWLNFWGMAFYFLVASVHSFCYAMTGRSVLFNKLPRLFRGLHRLFYTCITTLPFLVVVTFWTILYTPPWYRVRFLAWQNISQHGLVALFGLLEISLTTAPPHPLLHFACLVVILLLYIALAYLTHYTQGFYTYNFLDPGTKGRNSGRVAAYCFGILAGLIIIFAVSWFLIWIRQKLVRGRIRRSSRDTGYSIYNTDQGGLEGGQSVAGGAWREK